MDRTQSIFQPFITINYIKEQPENKLFDRKSSRVKPGDLAPIISAFANAEGGTIVIGVNDKTRAFEGVNGISSDQINDLISAPKDMCVPMPQYKEEFLPITNAEGREDRLLLLHIDASPEQMNACELAQNRDKMIKYTCLAGLGAFGLLVFGIASMISRE